MTTNGSFFNLGSQTTFINGQKQTLTLKINDAQTIDNVNFIFPTDPPYPGKVLTSLTATGDTQWSDPAAGSTPGGVSGSIQYNNANAFDGVSEFSYDENGKKLTVSNIDISGGLLTFTGDQTESEITNDGSLSIITTDGNIILNASGGVINISSPLVMTPRVYTTPPVNGLDLEDSSILIFNYNSDVEIDVSLNRPELVKSGQHLSIFYLNSDASGSLSIDFGQENIITGNGKNRYLIFNAMGQSAELIAFTFEDPIDNSIINTNFLVVNTGASVS